MLDPVHSRAEVEAVRRRRMHRAADAAALIVAALGAAVLLTWILAGEALPRLPPGVMPMQANAALACLAGGIALWILNRPDLSPRRLGAARALAVLMGLIGLLTLLEYAGGWNLGIDEILVRDRAGALDQSHPGRVAPSAALSFLLLALAMAGIDGLFAGGTVAVMAAGLIGLTAGVGYLLSAEAFYLVGELGRMPPATAVAVVFLSAGILLARPERGLMQVAASETFGGLFLRRILPAAAVGLVLVAWIRLQGQEAGLFGTEAGLLLVVVTTLVVFTLLIVRVAREVHAADLARLAAEASLARSERELRAQKSLLETVLDSVGVGVTVADQGGRLVLRNPEAVRILGNGRTPAGSEEWLPRERVLVPETRMHFPEEQQPLARVLRGEEAPDVEVLLRPPARGGKDTYLSVTARPLRDAGGALCGGVAVFRDETREYLARRAIEDLNRQLELKAARLAEVNKELETFSYSVSHDLRAPLRHIQGFVALLRKHPGAGLDEKQSRYLTLIADASTHMGQLIDDLLRFSLAGRSAIERRRIDLGPLMTSAIAEVQKECPDRAIEWVVGDLPAVTADPGLLRQVMVNLLSNAVKYTRSRHPARIEVGGWCDSDQDTVFVRDNGVGFDQSYANKLFNVFQRLHGEREFEGTGIGLALVRRIIERHSGKVRAEGEVGRGATFSFTLPCEDPQKARLAGRDGVAHERDQSDPVG